MTSQLSFDMIVPARDPSWRPPEPPDLGRFKDVHLDLETTGLRWRQGDRPIGIAVVTPDGDRRYLPFGHLGGGNLDEATVKRWAREQLRGKNLFFAHSKFDAHMFYAWGINLEEQGNVLGDVLHYAALLDDHRTKYKLEDVAQEYLGEGKTLGSLDIENLKRYHAGDVAPYAMQDADLVRRLYEKMNPLLDAQHLQKVRSLEDETVFAVLEMERNAAPIDVVKLKRWVLESEQRVLKMLYDLKKLLGYPVDPQRREHLEKVFRDRKIHNSYKTATGAMSFTDEILSGIEDEAVILVRRIRKLMSLRSKYLLPYFEAIGPDALLCYQLHQLRGDHGEGQSGTISGRFSASDKNIQQVMTAEKQLENLGPDFIIRELFEARVGQVLSADAAQIEFRLFAWLANSPTLNAAYRKDPRISFHKVVHEMVRALTVEIAYKQLKNLSFCKIYGGGIRKIALMMGVDLDVAESFVKSYDHAFPDANRLLRTAAKIAESRGFVKTLLGRRARFNPGCRCPACAHRGPRYHKALNGAIQGGAADVMKQKLCELHRARKKTGFIMRMTVHDEVVGDCPDDRCREQVSEILNAQTTIKGDVPILWDVQVGPNWAEGKAA